MKVSRLGIDRRSNINRRQLDISHGKPKRRKCERRNPGERLDCWVRTSEWSSVDIQIRNRYFWSILGNKWGALSPEEQFPD